MLCTVASKQNFTRCYGCAFSATIKERCRDATMDFCLGPLHSQGGLYVFDMCAPKSTNMDDLRHDARSLAVSVRVASALWVRSARGLAHSVWVTRVAQIARSLRPDPHQSQSFATQNTQLVKENTKGKQNATVPGLDSRLMALNKAFRAASGSAQQPLPRQHATG